MKSKEQPRYGIVLAKVKGHAYSLDRVMHDDKYVYTSGDSLFVWDKKTFELVATLCHSQFRRMALDREHLYTMSNDIITIWRKGDWTPILSVPAESGVHMGSKMGIQIDDNAIFTFHNDTLEKRDKQTLEVLESSTLVRMRNLKPRSFRNILIFRDYILGADAIFDSFFHWTKWDKKSLQRVARERFHGPAYQSMLFDRGILYAFSKKFIHKIDQNDFSYTHVKGRFPAEIRCLAVRDSRIYVGLEDGSVVVLDSETFEEEVTLRTEKPVSGGIGIDDIAVDESRVYVGAWGNLFKVFEIGSWKELFSSSGKYQFYRGLAHDDEALYATGQDNRITTWARKDLSQRKSRRKLQSNFHKITSDSNYLYAKLGALNSKTLVIERSNWKVVNELIMSEKQFSLLSESDYIVNYDNNRIQVWNKDFEEVAVLECNRSPFFRIKELDKGDDMDVSFLHLVSIDSEFIYIAYGKALLIWSRSKESFIKRVKLKREIESLLFDDRFIYATYWPRELVVVDKTNFRIIKTLEIKSDRYKLLQDDENVYDVGRNLSIIEKNKWVEKKVLPIKIETIESDTGYLRTIDRFGFERFYETREFKSVDRENTPWRGVKENSLHVFTNACLVYIPNQFDELKKHLKDIIQFKAPLVIVGVDHNPVAVIEAWYVQDNLAVFSEHLEKLKDMIEESGEGVMGG